MRIDHGLRVGNLTVRLVKGRNVKLVVFRNDKKELPHLTISWQNVSNEIDMHLTRRTSVGNKNHPPQQSIAAIPESVLKKACESFVAKMVTVMVLNIDKVQKVRPGWLARNRYAILYLPNYIQEQLIQKLVPERKRHGKQTRTVDKDVIMKRINLLQEVRDGLYHPSILHELAELEYREPLLAVSWRKKCNHRLIPLMLATNPYGRHCWVRIDNLAKKMMNNIEKMFITSLKEILPNNVWATVHTELHLDEIMQDKG